MNCYNISGELLGKTMSETIWVLLWFNIVLEHPLFIFSGTKMIQMPSIAIR